jgi:hypothetical protein
VNQIGVDLPHRHQRPQLGSCAGPKCLQKNHAVPLDSSPRILFGKTQVERITTIAREVPPSRVLNPWTSQEIGVRVSERATDDLVSERVFAGLIDINNESGYAFMALPCHDQLRAPFVTWKMPGSLLQSGVQLGPLARLSASKVHLIVWVYFWREL